MSIKILKIFVFFIVALWPVFGNASIAKKMLILENGFYPYYESTLNPPKGWFVEENKSKEMGVKFLIQNNYTFNDAPAIIYIKAVSNSQKQSLEQFIQHHIKSWKKENPDTIVTPITDDPLLSNLQGIAVFQFENPNLRAQSFEWVANSIDFDMDGNEYFIFIVALGKSKKDIENIKSEYVQLLQTHQKTLKNKHE